MSLLYGTYYVFHMQPNLLKKWDTQHFSKPVRNPGFSQTESPHEQMKKLAASQVPIILLTPPPVSSTAWDHYCTVISPRPLSPRSNENSKLYGAKVIEIGKEMGCPVVDTYTLLGGDKGEDYYGKYTTDGLHLTEEGNRIVFDGIMDVIQSDCKHLLPREDENDNNGVPLEEKEWFKLC